MIYRLLIVVFSFAGSHIAIYYVASLIDDTLVDVYKIDSIATICTLILWSVFAVRCIKIYSFDEALFTNKVPNNIVNYIIFFIFILFAFPSAYEVFEGTSPKRLIVYFFFMLATGFAEELIFRGLALPACSSKWGVKIGLLVSSLLFSAIHIFKAINPEVSLGEAVGNCITALVLGFLLGAMYLRSGNILVPIAFHFLYNLLLGYNGLKDPDIKAEGIQASGDLASTVVTIIIFSLLTAYSYRLIKLEGVERIESRFNINRTPQQNI